MRWSLSFACGIALVASDPSFADLVYFTRGGEAQLTAKLEGDRVRIETPDGPKIFPRADFASIIPGHRPLEDWAARRDVAIREGSVAARSAVAWWALENGLIDEAISDFLEIGPRDQAPGLVSRSVAAIGRLSAPCPDPDLEPLRTKLRPEKFRLARSPHVILFHQHSEAEALERLDVIEQVVKTFSIAFAAQGVEIPAPNRRLVSVYFADRRDYVSILRGSDAGAFASTQGYYHPVLRVVFAFDARCTDEQQAGRRAIGNRKLAGDPDSELARRSVLLDLDWLATDLGIAAHETVHQLTSESGLVTHFDDFPTWLHEGLAAQFEVVRGGRWAGFGRVNDVRMPDWRALRPAPRLAPLLRDSGFGHGYRRDLYAESWALVYFLRKAHPREFVAFLDLLRMPRTEATVRPERTFEAFLSAFGSDLNKLESEWHHYLANLKTPLEECRPHVTDQASGVDARP